MKRKFFWGDGDSDNGKKRKLHTIKWEIITTPKHRGGLGVQVLAWKNAALLAKWWWRARTEKTKLWCRLLTTKYGETFLTNPRIKHNKVSPMMHGISEIKQHQALKLLEAHDFDWKLGNGEDIRFWIDAWEGHTVLAEKYVRLFSIFKNKRISVNHMLTDWANVKLSKEVLEDGRRRSLGRLKSR